jgi:glyoxylase-like metal-dependent hydrolase (beta-lactamase superfamily II)
MQVHLLNCGSLCPLATERVLYGKGNLVKPGRICCQCLLIETNDRLALVDTGLGQYDIHQPVTRLGAGSAWLALRPERNTKLTAISQIKDLGYDPEDVTDIILTHLDPDHAGGLSDFPRARVHVHEDEWQAAVSRDRPHMRYRPQQWQHVKEWVRYRHFTESWLGFPAVEGVAGFSEDIALIPLAGHTAGSWGIALAYDGRWLFHIGDAIFHYGELQSGGLPCGLDLFAKAIASDDLKRRDNVARLQELNRHHQVKIMCSHDVTII